MKDLNFAERLIDWQRRHGRHDLPWQGTRDAYRVWLSEIMLQQTQVATVIPYYLRFVERFPTVSTLAEASVSTVLELWAGLGYYARARNLHQCAQIVVAHHGGFFPFTPSELEKLPGIRRSTAAAVSVFAFGNCAAILDGNVKRVLARCFGIEGFPGKAHTEREMWALAELLLPVTKVEAYTQGMMDLGAMLCTRRKPSCGRCPMLGNCVAQRDGRQHELPASRPAKALPEREASLILLTDGERVLVERRPPVGIWGGLLALPECPSDTAATFAQSLGCRVLKMETVPALRHTFTHFRLTLKPLLCLAEIAGGAGREPGFEWLDFGDVDKAGLPTPVRKILVSVAKEVRRQKTGEQ